MPAFERRAVTAYCRVENHDLLRSTSIGGGVEVKVRKDEEERNSRRSSIGSCLCAP